MTGEGLTAAEREALAEALGCEFHGADYGECASCASHAEQVWDDAVEAILTARTAQAEARGREAALREAASEVRAPLWKEGERASRRKAYSVGTAWKQAASTAANILLDRADRARADLAAEVGGDGGGDRG